MKKYAGAFVTVEYTLLITVIFMIYSFIIGIGVYMYNECIMGSNVRILALEGMNMSSLENKQKIVSLQKKESELYNEKYLFVEQMATNYSINGDRIIIKGQVFMDNPIAILGVGAEKWTLQDSCEVTAINPAFILRLCKRGITLGKEGLAEEETINE